MASSRVHALRLAESAVSRTRESENVLDLIVAYSARGSVRAANGLLEDGIADYRVALQAAEEYGVFHRRSVLEVNFGVLLMDVGAYGEAESVFVSARGKGDRENPFAVVNLATLAYEMGRFGAAEALAESCAAFGRRLDSVLLTPEAAAIIGLVALARGHRGKAEAAYKNLEGYLNQYVSISGDPTHVVAFAARMLVMRGEAERAHAMLLQALDSHKDRNLVVYLRLVLELARYLMDSKPELSFRHAREVAAKARLLGAKPLAMQAQTLLEEIELRGR